MLGPRFYLGSSASICGFTSSSLRARQKQMWKTDLRCDATESGLQTTQTRCDRSDLSCNQRNCVAIDSNHAATDAFAVRMTRKSCPPAQNGVPQTENTPRTMQNAFARPVSHSFPTQMRCKLYKRSRCGLIAVQNFTNTVVADLSHFKTMPTQSLRTCRSGKRQKWAATHLSQLRMAQNNPGESGICPLRS
jgi:hypothetical protein